MLSSFHVRLSRSVRSANKYTYTKVPQTRLDGRILEDNNNVKNIVLVSQDNAICGVVLRERIFISPGVKIGSQLHHAESLGSKLC